jgi:hypothetical protein
MTITLQLKPEIEQRLLAQAQAQGVSLESYVAGVIEAQALQGPKRRPTVAPAAGRARGERGTGA